ncbi:hypothetical protein F5X99DRAFT_405168 [Biscogniauxia marginata]|nr:hypothetical protein F5X99DRAFT_405168 [Biscogniauxia marginata]
MAIPPIWDAPHPFTGLTPGPPLPVGNGTFKVNLADAGQSHTRIARTLRKLLSAGGNLSKSQYLNELDIWESLNAYNVHTPIRRQRVWAWVNKWMLDVPRNAPANFNWANWLPDNEINSYSLSMIRDLRDPWTNLATNAQRIGIHVPRYRLIIFIHRHMQGRHHEPPGIDLQRIYSVSVWDRERDETIWHDPWPYDGMQRWTDIQAFWNNVPHRWALGAGNVRINFGANLQRRQYLALEEVQGWSHKKMDPCFTQFSVIGIILHVMNVMINTPGTGPGGVSLIAPDAPDVLSGMDHALIPRLIRCLLRTIRENGPVVEPRLRGNGVLTQAHFRNEYQIRDNPYLNGVMRMLLLAIWPASNPQNWLIDAIAPP